MVLSIISVFQCVPRGIDETIRSSRDTIRIGTKGDDMIIDDTTRVVIVKIQTFTIFAFFYLLFTITLKTNTTEECFH